MALSTPQFWAALLAAISAYSPGQLDPASRTPITPQSSVRNEYDFVIVGAGSAGAVLANRLSENPRRTVLLIEAGPCDDYKTDIPFVADLLVRTEKDWNYTSVKQEKGCQAYGGVCELRKGRGLGGCSSINWMIYNRGNTAHYDKWERMGNVGWNYDNLLAYFLRSENMTEPKLLDSGIHWSYGPLNVQYPKYVSPMRKEYVKAGQELGWNFTDYNGGEQRNVIDYLQYTINGHLRENTVKAYLDPIRDRKNLDVIIESVVTRVIIEDKTAKGVEYQRDGKIYKVLAKKDVILSAGAIESPKLLMLSGIGTTEVLKKHGIDILVDLPVGKFYQDHINVGLLFEVNANAETVTEEVWKTNKSILAYAKYKEGPLTMPTGGTEVTSFFNPLNETEPPTVQAIYCSATPSDVVGKKRIIKTWVVNTEPQSVGSVTLKSNDFRDHPLVDPNLFMEDIDREILEKGAEKVLEFMETKTMSRYEPKIYTSGKNMPKCAGKSGKEFIVCAVAKYSELTDRPYGTARMGPEDDKESVVDSKNFFVKGVKKLRVVDASIMPANPGANTNAPVIMLAERAADIIMVDHYYDNINSCGQGNAGVESVNGGGGITSGEEGTEEGGDTTDLEGTTEESQGHQHSHGGYNPEQKPSMYNYFFTKVENLLKPKTENS